MDGGVRRTLSVRRGKRTQKRDTSENPCPVRRGDLRSYLAPAGWDSANCSFEKEEDSRIRGKIECPFEVFLSHFSNQIEGGWVAINKEKKDEIVKEVR